MVVDRNSEQLQDESQAEGLSFNPESNINQESSSESSNLEHPSIEKKPYKAIRSILRGMQTRQQNENSTESTEQESNLNENKNQIQIENPDFSRSFSGFESDGDDQDSSSNNREFNSNFPHKTNGLTSPQVNPNFYPSDFSRQGNNQNSGISSSSGLKMNLFSNFSPKEFSSEKSQEKINQHQPFPSSFGPIKKNPDQNRLFPEEIPNSFQKSLFKQNMSNELRTFPNPNPGNSEPSPPSWEDQTRLLLKGRSIQAVARHQGEFPENPSNFLHSSNRERISMEDMPDFRPPPPKLPPQPHQTGSGNISNHVNPQDMLFKSPSRQRLSNQFSNDLKEYSRLGLKHALPPPPKLPPGEYFKNRKGVHTEPAITINAPDLRNNNNLSGNVSCAGLHSVNWFCTRPTSLSNLNPESNPASNLQGNNIKHFNNPVERESHMLEILQRIQTRDMLRSIVLQALRNGQPHFESELHRLVKEKKPQLGSVAFGLIMYSLVEMFGGDMIRMQEDSRGKFYVLSDEFKKICELGFTM